MVVALIVQPQIVSREKTTDAERPTASQVLQQAGPLTAMSPPDRKVTAISLRVPNHNARPGGVEPGAIIIHGTGSGAPGGGNESFTQLRRWFSSSRDVSAHYAIDRKGKVVQFVADSRRAWHVAAPGWNDISIGIELINDNSGTQPFSEPQLIATRRLVQQLGTRHDIPAEYVYRHRDVQPWDRADPAYNFPWKAFKSSLKPGGAPAPLTSR